MSEIEQFFAGLSQLEFAGIIAGGVAAVILFCVCLCWCCLRRYRDNPDEADMMLAAQYRQNQQAAYSMGRQASAGTFARFVNARPSGAVNKFKRKTPTASKMEEGEGSGSSSRLGESLDESSISPKSTGGFNTSVMDNINQKNKKKAKIPKAVAKSRAQQGQSYGRLDPEAQERIRSVRMSANLTPILPAGGNNAKALRMMGITEAQANKQYDESVEKRMRRIAAGAAGGGYSAGFSTAGLGNEIIGGFQARREKLEAKKKNRDERKRMQNENQERQNTLSRKKKDETPKKAPPPKPVVEKKKPKGLSQFLAEEEKDSDEESEHIDDEI